MASIETVRDLLAAGDLDGARDGLVDVLYEDYDHLEAWLLLTACAADEEEYARAIREALRIDPENQIARRLAVEHARTGPTPSASGEGRVREQTGNAVRSITNWIIFGIVITIGALIAVGVAFVGDENATDESSDSLAAANAVDFCAAIAEETYQRLEARCGLVDVGTVCLGNADVTFESEITSSLPVLPGDRVVTTDLIAFTTLRYDSDVGSFGLAVAQGASDFPVQMLVTSGVRVSGLSDGLSNISISSNPVLSDCDEVPAPGVVLIGGLSEAIRVNGLALLFDGVVFLQADAGGGMRLVVLQGNAQLRFEGINTTTEVSLFAGEWTTLEVDDRLEVIGTPKVPSIGNPPVRGDVQLLLRLGDALGIETRDWRIPTGAVQVAVQPTVTATRGIRVPSATIAPTHSNTPRFTLTLRPSRTPTNTPQPTSTSIPVIEDEPTVTVTPSAETNAVSSGVRETLTDETSPVAGTWACIATIDTAQFDYVLTIEPRLVRDQVFASAIIPTVGSAVVTLVGTIETEIEALDADWSRLPSYQLGDAWLLLQEDAVLYTLPGSTYEANGTFRLIHDAGDLRGGIFNGNRLIGILTDCNVDN